MHTAPNCAFSLGPLLVFCAALASSAIPLPRAWAGPALEGTGSISDYTELCVQNALWTTGDSCTELRHFP